MGSIRDMGALTTLALHHTSESARLAAVRRLDDSAFLLELVRKGNRGVQKAAIRRTSAPDSLAAMAECLPRDAELRELAEKRREWLLSI